MENSKDNESFSFNNEQSPGKINFSLDIPHTEYIQCFICGHKNPPDTGICVMCSNYLFTKLNSKKGGK